MDYYWSVKIVLRDRAAGEQVAGSRERIEKLIILFLISKLTDYYYHSMIFFHWLRKRGKLVTMIA
jgi:hypothetical protein